MQRWTGSGAVGLLVFLGLLFPAAPSTASQWEWEIGLYAWLATQSGTVTSALDTLDVQDLTESTNFSMAVHFEAASPKLTWIGDIYYVSWDAKPVTADSVSTGLELDQWVFEGSAAYRLAEPIEVLASGRVYTLQALLNQGSLQSRESDEIWADFFVGARASGTVKEKWLLSLRGDVGAGSSNFSWFANAFAGYQLAGDFQLGLSYRLLSVDYESGSGDDFFGWDVIQQGFGIYLGRAYN